MEGAKRTRTPQNLGHLTGGAKSQNRKNQRAATRVAWLSIIFGVLILAACYFFTSIPNEEDLIEVVIDGALPREEVEHDGAAFTHPKFGLIQIHPHLIGNAAEVIYAFERPTTKHVLLYPEESTASPLELIEIAPNGKKNIICALEESIAAHKTNARYGYILGFAFIGVGLLLYVLALFKVNSVTNF